MSCINPIRIKNPRYEGIPPDQWYVLYPEFKPDSGILPIDYYIDVPCGNCHECASSKRYSWVFRLKEEYRNNPQALFITLTFNDFYYNKYFPDGNITNKPLSLFLDRFRKKYGKQIRHFFIGEFGKDNNRFHYHGLFFGIDYLDVDELNYIWKYGFTWVGYCNEKTINYVTKYIVKSVDLEYKIPRIMASPGIGASYINSPDGQYLFNRQVPLNSIVTSHHILPIPRYIKNKGISEANRRLLFRDYLLNPNSIEIIGGEKYPRNSIIAAKARENLKLTRQQQGFILPKKTTKKSKLNTTYGDY